MVVGLSEVLAGHADVCACWIRVGLAALNVPQYGRSICFTQGLLRPYGPHWPEIWHVDETPVEGYDGLFDDLGLVPTRQGL